MGSSDHRDCSWHSFGLFIGLLFFLLVWSGLFVCFSFSNLHTLVCYLLNSEILVSSGSFTFAIS